MRRASPNTMQKSPWNVNTCTFLMQDVADKTPEDAGRPSTGRYIVSAKGLVRDSYAGHTHCMHACPERHPL
jgi:hypothetical protein